MTEEVALGQVHREELHAKIKANELGLRKLIPEEWTLMSEINPAYIGFQLKLLGFDWRTNTQFSFFMGQLADLKIVQLKAPEAGSKVPQWRRSPEPLYQTQQG